MLRDLNEMVLYTAHALDVWGWLIVGLWFLDLAALLAHDTTQPPTNPTLVHPWILKQFRVRVADEWHRQQRETDEELAMNTRIETR